jgi:hypothetical protein
MQILQLQCLSPQLRNAGVSLSGSRGSKPRPQTEEDAMRLVETAAAGVIALAAQILVVATILI